MFKILLITLFLFIPPSLTNANATKPLPRTILALYNPKTTKDPFHSEIHQSAAVVLNHLGLKIQYRSLRDPLPQRQELGDIRGILTWFNPFDVIPDPKSYCRTLNDLVVNGVKLVILEDFGFAKKSAMQLPRECEALFKTLGAQFKGEFSDNPYFFHIDFADPEMVEFERKLTLAENIAYDLIKTTDRQARVYLKISRTDLEDSGSDLVFTTPQGGYAHTSFVLMKRIDLDKKSWRLNPFRFFSEAFAIKGIPSPDTTTINGNRIFYTHIDGDGLFNVSDIDRKSFSGEVILDEILKRYKTIPITASLIAGYFDMQQYQGERTRTLYKNIFSLPNTEPASHGYAHPLSWRKGNMALDLPGYTFTPQAEIKGAIQKMSELLQKLEIHKQINLFTWTGDCFPSADQIRVADAPPLLNINGGDSRFDRRYDSYAFLAPLGIDRNNALQIYSSNSNEYTYTNKWQGPFYGFNLLKETLQNSESPIRIKPINIYYHYYSAETQASLTALKSNYDFALKQEIFPIHTSEYPPIVKGFYSAKIYEIPGGHHITDNGTLKTIRYDDEKQNVDLNKSTGVLGFNHYQGSLYVFLDDSPDHRIFLDERSQIIPHLKQASFAIKDFSITLGTIQFQKRGWYQSKMILGGLKPTTNYTIETSSEKLKATSSAQGTLDIMFKQAENEKDFEKVIIKPDESL